MTNIITIGSPDPIPGEIINPEEQLMQPLEIAIKGHQAAVEQISAVLAATFSTFECKVMYAHHPVEFGQPTAGRKIITRHVLQLRTINGRPVVAR